LVYIYIHFTSTVRHIEKEPSWPIINLSPGFMTKSRKKIVNIILAVLFFTALGQIIVQWYYVYICFVGETKIRMDTFILTVNGNSMVNTVSASIFGIGQILADALLVSTELPLAVLTRFMIKLSDLAFLPYIDNGSAEIH